MRLVPICCFFCCVFAALPMLGVSALTAALPPWLHNPAWNILRLTGRGTDDLDEVFMLAPDGTTFRFR